MDGVILKINYTIGFQIIPQLWNSTINGHPVWSFEINKNVSFLFCFDVKFKDTWFASSALSAFFLSLNLKNRFGSLLLPLSSKKRKVSEILGETLIFTYTVWLCVYSTNFVQVQNACWEMVFTERNSLNI